MKKLSPFLQSLRRQWYLVVAAILVIIGIFYFLKGKGNEEIFYEMVKSGTVVQAVTITGKTQPISSVSLAFEKAGRVREVRVKVGDQIEASAILAILDQSELSPQLEEAQAGVLAAEAKLGELKKGTRPEELAIKQSEVDKARQDLVKEYAGIFNSINDAYGDVYTAVRENVDDLFAFSSNEQADPQLNFNTRSDSKINAEAKRSLITKETQSWLKELNQLSSASTQGALEEALQKSKNHITAIKTAFPAFDEAVRQATAVVPPLASATVDSYRAALNTALTAINGAYGDLTDKEESIAVLAVTVKRVENELALKVAGNTSESIAAQEATVAQARAKVSNLQAQIAKNTLRSPIRGIITKQDAKVGEIVSPNTPLISIISEDNLEIEANVPEIDIGKVQNGNVVRITLDAFPGETFAGKVFYIDPAETIVDGVVNFKIKIAFEGNDPRMKSGLTANLDIETEKKENVLVLPSYAILENDNGTFVRIDKDGATEERKVELGVRGEDGFVEIVSGVTNGERVLNIGRTTQ